MPTHPRVGRSARVVAALAAVALVASCGGDGDGTTSGDGDRPVVVTDMYPTTFAVQQVAGDAVEVVQLAPAGVEPHDYELTPRQVAAIADADLVAYVPGMIPAVAEAVAQEAADRGLDITAGIDRRPLDAASGDPHVWLDPAHMATMGRTAADALSTLGIDADPAALEAAMETLAADSADALAACAIDTMVVSHAAFGYLADAHGFTQVAISGLSPASEPSPAKLAEIAQLVEDRGVTTIYFEALASPESAQAIAAETGAATALLDPIEGNTDDRGYEALMRANLAALQTGQGCG